MPPLAELRRAILSFIDAPGPIAVEVGFDFGEVIIDQAIRLPETRWLGLEIRAAQVIALSERAPPNCLPARLDARTLFGAGVLDGRISRVDILFPTPALKGRHLLWTPAFVTDLARSLTPSGVLTVATDVPALAQLIEQLLTGWPEAPPPPRAEALSRRERVCRRDDITCWWTSRFAPSHDPQSDPSTT